MSVYHVTLLALCAVAFSIADKPPAGYSSHNTYIPPPQPPTYHQHIPSYHHPQPVHYPIHVEQSGYYGKGGSNKFSPLQKGLSLLKRGKGRGKKGRSSRVRYIEHYPAPVACKPVTHVVTQHITEHHPVEVVKTELVEVVVPSVVVKTQHERLVHTTIVTDVIERQVTQTRTQSVPVTQFSTLTLTETERETSNIIQTTTEVSFTPVVTTVQVTQTDTTTQTETVPDLRISHVTQSVVVPTTEYVTVTQTNTVTNVEYIERPAVNTYLPPAKEIITSTVLQNNYLTDTVYQTVTVPEIRVQTDIVTETKYSQVTQVVKEQVTVQAKCGGGYSVSQPQFQAGIPKISNGQGTQLYGTQFGG